MGLPLLIESSPYFVTVKYLRAASAAGEGLQAMEAPKRAAGRGCVKCGERAHLKRPKTMEAICRPCFFTAFENEVHETIVSNKLFKPGERVAIAASGARLLQYLAKRCESD